MHLRFLIIFIVALSSIYFPIKTYADSIIYENQQIESIEVQVDEETDSYFERMAKSRMQTKEGGFFSQFEFDQDLKTLAKDFDRIDPRLDSQNGRLKIYLYLAPKPKIQGIQFVGNCKVDSAALLKELDVRPGALFDRQIFNKSFHKLKAYYIKQGFFEASISYEAELDPCTKEVDIIITVVEGRAGMIQQIVFSGFSSDEEDDLTEMMITKKYTFIFSLFNGEGVYHEEAMQQDQFMILNYLQNKGYADAVVDVKVQEASDCNRIILYITADRGCPYAFGSITFEGNTLFCTDDIRGMLRIHEGSPYAPERARLAVDNVTALYGRKGYIDTVVSFEPTLAPETCAYDINIVIDEGPLYRIGMIKIFGNCITETEVILHETLLVPGDVFNTDKLRNTEARLRNIGYFKNVNVYAVRSEEGASCLGDNYRDVHIEVEETSTGNFGAFFGFSTAENIFGGFNITERNFNSKGFLSEQCGTSRYRGGGEYAHATILLGGKSSKYLLSWSKPYFWDTKWSVGCDFEKSYSRYISDDYTIVAAGYTLHGTYDVNAFVKTGVHYRVRRSDLEIRSGDCPKELLKDAQTGVISAVGSSWIYDSTDSITRPTNGFKSRLATEFAGLGGDFSFISLAYLNTFYYPLDTRTIIKLRWDFRFIQPLFSTNFDNIPLDERFFLGGDSEIRGYRPYRLGNKFCSDEPKGGISMQLYSYELSRRLWKRLDAFAFFDAGYLSNHKWRFHTPWFSCGGGIRFQIFETTPPLTVGYGFPLNAPEKTDIKRFFISIGGKF